MSFAQIIIITIITGLVGIDCYMEVFQTYRPLILGTIIGLVMGDIKTGLIIGATFEMMWMGLMPIGGAVPPNMVIGTVIGVVFGIASGKGADVAIGFGVPFAVLMQGIVILMYTGFSYFNTSATKYIKQGKSKQFDLIQLKASIVIFFCYAIVAFLPIWLGIDKAEVIVNILPEWLINGLSVAGGLMPAIGFAILLNTMFKKDYIIFLAMGFILVTYLSLPILPLAVIGVCIAVYDYMISGKKATALAATTESEDYTDGI